MNPKTGITIEGTDVGPGKTSTCPACVASLAKALSAPAVGAYLPQCDSTGNFTPLQRHPTSLRWCVDPKTGAKVPGSERPKGQPAPACK